MFLWAKIQKEMQLCVQIFVDCLADWHIQMKISQKLKNNYGEKYKSTEIIPRISG